MKIKSKIHTTPWVLILVYVGVFVYQQQKALPAGVSVAGSEYSVSEEDVEFLADETYMGADGQRQMDHQIFDEVFSMIDDAQEFILIDMFLFNDFLGVASEPYRNLSSELTQKLIDKKTENPNIQIVFITDPINEVYGGDESATLESLRQAGIQVIITDLTKLRDSNPIYSSFWRVGVQWWGNATDGWLPHVLDARADKLTLRTYLSLLNFKANHRKVVVADTTSDGARAFQTLITSANPHDGSSAHSNSAILIRGDFAQDVILSERAVADFSGQDIELPDLQIEPSQIDEVDVASNRLSLAQLLTEKKIKTKLIEMLGETSHSDQIDIMMFYMSDRDVISAIKQAADRGAKVRLILDPNKDAFGREKNGIPNRQAAYEIVKNGNAEVRWCSTHGEQCHSKMILIRSGEGLRNTQMMLGSANYTRRNIGDYNLETNIFLSSDSNPAYYTQAQELFDRYWSNDLRREYTVGDEVYQDGSLLRVIIYRFMEATGISSF